MRTLEPSPTLAERLPPTAIPYLPSVSLALAPEDGMFKEHSDHYLSAGASALNVILATLQIAATTPPSTILDFGAGAGRVTRWLRAAFPIATIDACDLRRQDMDFVASTFGIHTWVSSKDVSKITAPRTYDLIWLGSVLTHLPEEATRKLLAEKIYHWTNSRGIVVASLHGRTALEKQRIAKAIGQSKYNIDEGWPEIEAGYDNSGYGYADYATQVGYGISVSRLTWAAEFIELLPDCRIIMLAERAWDNHQDIAAFQRH